MFNIQRRPKCAVRSGECGMSGLRRRISIPQGALRIPPSALLGLLALLAWAPATIWAQPANDNFTNALVISGSVGTTSGTTIGATREANEPIYDPSGFGFGIGTHSVWFRWTA